MKHNSKGSILLLSVLMGVSSGLPMTMPVMAAEEAMDQNLNEGLVLSMSLDGNYSDAAGNYTPEFKGSGSVTYEEGVKGQAMRFSSDSSNATRLEFSGREDLQFSDTDAFTIGAWVKIKGIDGSPVDPALFGNKDWDWGANNGFVLAIRDNYFNFNTKNRSTHTRYDNKFYTTFENQWHFVVVSQNEKGESSIYVDGVKGTHLETSDTGSNDTSSGNFTIGGNFTGYYGIKDQAAYDELKVWNRVLSEDEIQYLYANTASLSISGADSLDLSGEEDVTAVYSLESAGLVTGTADWSCDNSQIQLLPAGATSIRVKVPGNFSGNSFKLTATKDGEVYEKTITIARDLTAVSAKIQGENFLKASAGDQVTYHMATFNAAGTPLKTADVNWSLESDVTGIELSGEGQNAVLKISDSAALPLDLTIKAKTGSFEDSLLVHVYDENSLPASINNKAEYYLPFEKDLKDAKGHELSVQGSDIQITEAGNFGNGATFTKGSYIDFGHEDLANSSIAFSIRSNYFSNVNDPCVVANKNWDVWDGSGFTFAYAMGRRDTWKNRLSYRTASGSDFFVSQTDSHWNDIVLSFDTDNDKYLFYVNGRLQDSVTTTDFVEDWKNGGFDGSTLNWAMTVQVTMDQTPVRTVNIPIPWAIS